MTFLDDIHKVVNECLMNFSKNNLEMNLENIPSSSYVAKKKTVRKGYIYVKTNKAVTRY